jgi:arylsulfatase A
MQPMSIRASFACLLLGACVTPAAARQPNIILIMADDLGYETITANGGQSYQTPHLDQLAATGMRFDNCYVQPVCTPTRIELMTGMSNARNYIRFGVIDRNATTFAHLLKNAGYATAVAGKWQLGREKDSPEKMGFDESCLWQHTRRPSRYANPGLEYNGEERDFNNGEYGPDLVNQFALDFIERNKERPFFLYYPMLLTHGPYQPTPDSDEWDPKFDGNEQEMRKPKHFGEMVTYMDKLVGKVAAKVDELGLGDDTLILFLGDNGTGGGTVSQFEGKPYKGGKGKATARGMHVPLIVNWRDHVPAGKENDDLVGAVDFLPTLCEAAGVEVPSTLKIDGRSFLPQALGQPGQPREWLYTWYSSDGSESGQVEFARTKAYKLYRGGRFFDLTKDPYEEGEALREEKLTGEQAEVAKKLRAVLDEHADIRPAELKKDQPDEQSRKARRARKQKRQQRRERQSTT